MCKSALWNDVCTPVWLYCIQVRLKDHSVTKYEGIEAMMTALLYFHSQGNMRGKNGRALVTKLLKWWAAGCPSPTSEDEQLCPAAVDEEACSVQDHKGISPWSSIWPVLTGQVPLRALRMMPCFSTNIIYICEDNCWYKRKINKTFEEGILCNL